MPAPTDFQFAVEVHPPAWNFPAGPSWIAGWIQPAAGQTITDVRLRLHHRVILGLCGLPHPAFGESSAAPADCGFSFLFAPQPGATLLRLETRSATGEWTEFFRTKISTAPEAAEPPAPPNLHAALRPQLTALLKLRLLYPRRAWTDLADDIVTAFVAEPLDSHPNAPFVGELEEPRARGRLQHGRISVTGWLAHPSAPIAKLTAVIDPLPAATLTHGLARADIAEHFSSANSAGSGAFVGEIALPAELAAPVLLKIFAELADGGKSLVFARRFTPQFSGTVAELPPMVPTSVFFRAARELLHSGQRHGLPGSSILGNARTVWAAFRSMPAYRTEDRAHLVDAKPHSDRKPPRPDPAGTSSYKDDYRAAMVGVFPDCVVIAPADDMCVPDASHYFQVGREALSLVQSAVERAGTGPVTAILDLPSGYGRVARWFRTAYPAAKLTVSDTQPEAMAFCAGHLGATAVLAAVDGSHWTSLPGPYDIIWCGSLLTHFDSDEWARHLRRFAERLSPDGVLVFTSHGLPVLDKMQSGEKNYGLPPDAVARLCREATETGFGYAAYADTPAYGISVAQPGWMRAFVAAETDLEILEIQVAGWGRHQDVVVCKRRSAKS